MSLVKTPEARPYSVALALRITPSISLREERKEGGRESGIGEEGRKRKGGERDRGGRKEGGRAG